MSISAKTVSKLYGEQRALDGVSLEVKPGEILGFLGPNGAGKSTLMKIITGFIPASEGSVTVCDLNVEEKPLDIKRKVGYLPELNPLYGDMYVKEYLMFVSGVYGLKNRKDKVRKMIERVGLSVEQNKKISMLSKGYKQRVGLAQALIHDPEVLILDEPTTGLDPNQISDIRDLIREIGKEKTVMLSTHIMQEVEAICDRVVIINKGKIVANEAVGNLKKLSAKQSILNVQFDGEVSKASLERIRGVDRCEELEEHQWKIRCKEGVDVRKELNTFAGKHKVSILSLSVEESSMEQIFKKLTREKDETGN